MTPLGRAARSFGNFWWDFLIGDTPELFGAVVVIIVVALLLRHHHGAAIIVLPALAVVSLLTSVWRGARTHRPQDIGSSAADVGETRIRSRDDLPIRSESPDQG